MKKILIIVVLLMIIGVGYVAITSNTPPAGTNSSSEENNFTPDEGETFDQSRQDNEYTEVDVENDIYKTPNDKGSKIPGGDVSFGGTLEAVSTACYADGICSATVEGKTVIIIEGWKQGVVGEVRFDDGIGGLEAHIGKPVFVYAAKTATGYTLYGSAEYYIEPAI